MAIDTYDGLKASIISHLDRDDLSDYADDFIDIAEARHAREIRIQEMLKRQSVTVATRYVDLPVNFLEVQQMRLLTSPVSILRYCDMDDFTARRRWDINGIPKYFTIHEQIEMDVEPDQGYQGEFLYWKKLTALSSTNQTNSLLNKAADIYLYSSLAAAAPFLMHDERIPTWEKLYGQAAEGLMIQEGRRRRVGTPIARVKGV